MTISRTSTAIYRGPAIVTYNSQVFYFKGGLTVTPRFDLFDIPTDAFGVIDQRVKQIVWEVTGTPVGKVSADMLTTLLPHTQCNPGVSAMPATDKALVITPLNSKEQLTLKSAFVFKQPSLELGATKSAFDQVTWYAIGTDAEAWSAANHMYTLADVAFADTSLSKSDIKTVPFTAVLGAVAAPWNLIQTKEGWKIDFDIGLNQEDVDDTGAFDWTYTGVANVTLSCKPIGIKVADLLSLMLVQGTGAARGMSHTGFKADLVLSGGSGNITFTAKNVIITSPPHVYNAGDRVDTLTFKSVRSLTTGALDALYTIGMVA